MREQELLEPTEDLVFRALFGQEDSKPLLISLLNAVLGERYVERVEYQNPFSLKDGWNEKTIILDIRVLTQRGEHINVEIQVANQTYYRNRSLYYWARVYSQQLQESRKYDTLKKTICINFLSFSHFQQIEKLHTVFRIYEKETHELLTDHLELHFLELPKFTADQGQIQPQTALGQWLRFFKYGSKMTEEELKGMQEPVQDAHKKLSLLSADERFRSALESHRMYEMDRAQQLADAVADAVANAVTNTQWKSAFESLQEDLADDHGIDLTPYHKQLRQCDAEFLKQLRRKWRRAPQSQIISELDAL